MNKWDNLLQFSKEGREWVKTLVPAFITLHMKQPWYVDLFKRVWARLTNKKDPKNDNRNYPDDFSI